MTATTVGYGDLSPGTDAGQLVAVLFVVPGGIAIFTALPGKVLAGVSDLWRQRMNGAPDPTARSRNMAIITVLLMKVDSLAEVVDLAGGVTDVVCVMRQDALSGPVLRVKGGMVRCSVS